MDEPDLQCIICTKQPQFSDLSHLLTHVASKAHLANQFSMKVRSAANPRAAELLNRYDYWYDAHNLGSLLSVRLDTKEQRKKRKSEETTKLSQKQPKIKQESTVEPIGFSTPAALSVPDCIDPRLAGSYNGQRKEDAGSPATPIRWTTVNSNERTRTGPILRSMRTSMDEYSTGLLPLNVSALGNNKLSMYPVTPTQPRRKRNTEDMEWALSQETPNPFVHSADRTRASGKSGTERTTGFRAEEIARLKGVLWPGMDCFDAATEEMRRRRNQKKDGTVLKQMEITSTLVEPSELIFSPSGKFLKERVITGNVEEDTPLKGETPVPRRRQARPRGALTRADPNVPRAMHRKRQKTAAPKRCKITSDNSVNEYKSPRRSGRMAGPSSTHTSYDGEFDMSVNAFGKRARGGFDVFSDEDGGKQTYLSQGMDMGPQGQFGTLTPTRLLLDRKQTASGTHASKIARTAADKENIEPILNRQGRIDFGLGPHGYSPFAKRTDPDVFGAQYFDELSLIGLSGPFIGNDKTGCRSNPLFAPKPTAYDNPFKEEENEADQVMWLPIAQAPAPEETISEDEQLEFPGLYLVPCAD